MVICKWTSLAFSSIPLHFQLGTALVIVLVRGRVCWVIWASYRQALSYWNTTFYCWNGSRMAQCFEAKAWHKPDCHRVFWYWSQAGLLWYCKIPDVAVNYEACTCLYSRKIWMMYQCLKLHMLYCDFVEPSFITVGMRSQQILWSYED